MSNLNNVFWHQHGEQKVFNSANNVITKRRHGYVTWKFFVEKADKRSEKKSCFGCNFSLVLSLCQKCIFSPWQYLTMRLSYATTRRRDRRNCLKCLLESGHTCRIPIIEFSTEKTRVILHWWKMKSQKNAIEFRRRTADDIFALNLKKIYKRNTRLDKTT